MICINNTQVIEPIPTENQNIQTAECSTNIACKFCSIESNNYNLCESCNIEKGYYPLKNDTNNYGIFINCYNDITIYNGYYLNEESKQYEKCYSLCEKCNELGDENDNKCNKCSSGFTLLKENFKKNNCYINCPYYYYFDINKIYHCSNDYKCPDEYNKLIAAKGKCIDKCSNDNLYQYEYNGNCYEIFPNNTILSNNNICIFSKQESCSLEFPYLIYEINECTNNCNITDWISRKCITNNTSEKLKDKNIYRIMNSIPSHSIDSLLDNIADGEDILIDEKEIKYQITNSENQNKKEYDDISTIILGECENILKNYYNISNEESILILKLDIYYEGQLSPIVIYELYHPKTKKRLDLIHCKNTTINILIPVKINKSELFKYDPSNKFYNDICSTYTSEIGTDITLKDRQNEFINNNLSLCEEECKLSHFEHKERKVNCECFIKLKFPLFSEIKIDKEKLRKNFIDIKNLINLNVLKCYKLLLTKEGLIYNIGSYILIAIIFIYSINSNLFLIIEYDILFNKIDLLFKKKKKENNNNWKHNFSNNKTLNNKLIKKNTKIKKTNRILKNKTDNIKINKNKSKIKKGLNAIKKNKKITFKSTDSQSVLNIKLMIMN